MPIDWESDEALKEKIRNVLTNGLSPTIDEKVENIFRLVASREKRKVRRVATKVIDALIEVIQHG